MSRPGPVDPAPRNRWRSNVTGAWVAALASTLGIAGVAWAAAVWQMRGMDMGPATRLGPFAGFLGAWTTMMAAMMLPGAAPAVARRARDAGRAVASAPFLVVYLGVWVAVGTAAYPVYRPHGTPAAGLAPPEPM